jgi:hypothetical protein
LLECRLSNWVVQMWKRLTGLAIAVVAIAAGAIPLAQSVINMQQDADDLPRLGETATERTRLSRTQGERAQPAPVPSAGSDVDLGAAQRLPQNNVLVNGALAVPGAPANTGTVPAKFSAKNAADDELISIAYTFKPLTDDERRVIYQSLKDQPAGSVFNADIGTKLPPGIELRPVPEELAARVPQTRNYRYAVAMDRVLLVGTGRTVMGVFADAPTSEAQTPIPAPKAASPTTTTDRTAVEAQTATPAPRPTAATDQTAVEAQMPIPAAAAASPTATPDQTTVEAQTPDPAPQTTAVEAQTPIPAPAAASPTATKGRTAVAPASEQNVRPSDQGDADEIVVLLKRGQELMRHGDLAAARLVLRHAADANNAEAALTLGATYDPVILRELRVYGFSADVGMARTWYEKAKELGLPEAARRLDNLAR